jgi:hypothetical protein
VFPQIQRTIVVASATFALAACGRGAHAITAVPDRAASSERFSTLAAERNAPPGTELESGVPFMITDGRHHVMFAPSAVVSKADDGAIVVTVGSYRQVFSANAVITRSGHYHRYAGVAH